MFQLANQEWNVLKSQFATSSWGGVRKLPYVFGEHGVLMLSSILNSKRAIQVNILIMRVFTNARKLLMDTTELRLEIEKIKLAVDNQGKNMEVVFQYLDELQDKVDYLQPNSPFAKNPIGFKIK